MSLTDWEVGQDLIKCADMLSEVEKELRDAGRKELADDLHEMRLKIGDRFNKLHSHEFGLPAHDPKDNIRKCESCGGPGPCLWDPRTGRYACRKCHSQPNDSFFLEAARRNQ